MCVRTCLCFCIQYVGGLRGGEHQQLVSSFASALSQSASFISPLRSFLLQELLPLFLIHCVCVCVCVCVCENKRQHRSVMINEIGTAVLFSCVKPETGTERTRFYSPGLRLVLTQPGAHRAQPPCAFEGPCLMQ